MSLKIVFMGTPEFSVPTLKALIKNKFNIISVYTQPPAKSHRGQKINFSPVQQFSEKNNSEKIFKYSKIRIHKHSCFSASKVERRRTNSKGNNE